MKTLKRSLLATAAILAMGTQAHAAQGQTSVSFNFPNIVILHYVSDVTFDIPATVLGGADQAVNEGTGGTFTTLTGNTGMALTINQTLNGFLGAANNAWAVRGITTSGNIQVSIASTSLSATNGTSTVAMSNLQVSDGTNTAQTITVPAPGFAGANAVFGNVLMTLDFSGVTVAGTHTGATYTVTATAI